MQSLMSKLELKIPPLAVALLCLGLIFLASRLTPGFELPPSVRVSLAILLLVSGAFFGVGGIRAFRQARTTVNPMNPDKSTSLVTDGVFRYTRNPMYLGVALTLLAIAVFLSNALGIAAALVFIPYMNRFQIGPEERVIKQLFGRQYEQYCNRVRRWL